MTPQDYPLNLFSDTQTRPTAAMRRAMAGAEVGDEQLGTDPTVNALCERVAALPGMEAAVFMPIADRLACGWAVGMALDRHRDRCCEGQRPGSRLTGVCLR